MGTAARSYDPALAGEGLSVEVELEGLDAVRLRDYMQRFGYGSYAVAIVAILSVALDNMP